MKAFLPPAPLLGLRPHATTLPRFSNISYPNRFLSQSRQCAGRVTVEANLASKGPSSLPGFRRDEDDTSSKTQSTFFPDRKQKNAVQSPNDRILEQVRNTMERLGVSEVQTDESPVASNHIDISNTNPLSAFAGAGGAAFISFVAWQLLNATVAFAVSHPLDDQVYVVQRLAAVVRTTLVCLFALGSGISGVTGLGLALLGLRTSYGHITKEYSDKY